MAAFHLKKWLQWLPYSLLAMFYNLLSSISVSAKTMDEEVMLIEPLAIEEPPKAVAKC